MISNCTSQLIETRGQIIQKVILANKTGWFTLNFLFVSAWQFCDDCLMIFWWMPKERRKIIFFFSWRRRVLKAITYMLMHLHMLYHVLVALFFLVQCFVYKRLFIAWVPRLSIYFASITNGEHQSDLTIPRSVCVCRAGDDVSSRWR